MDYRALKERTKAEIFSLMMIGGVIEYMAGPKIFSNLDMFAFYWQIM